MKEIWKAISGYEGYEISSLGRVKSLDRLVKTDKGLRKVNERILKQKTSSTKYLRVCVSKNSNSKFLSVHRLVAQQFIENPENKPQVNHIDFNRANNNLSNLEWTTAQENMDHSVKAGRYNKTKKRVMGVNVENGYVLMLESIHSGENYGFDPSKIVKVCKGKRKTTNGFTFNYL